MKEKILNGIGVAIFYVVLIIMVLIVNFRYTNLNQSNGDSECRLAFNN